MKFLRNIKKVCGDIHWPSMKEIVSDTLLTVGVTTVLALAVGGWTNAIEYVVNWILSLF